MSVRLIVAVSAGLALGFVANAQGPTPPPAVAPAVEPRARLLVEVVDAATRTGVAGAVVAFQCADGVRGFTATTNTDGRFVAEDLAPGRCTGRGVRAAGYSSPLTNIRPIELAPGEQARVVFEVNRVQSGRVRGVLSDPRGMALAGAAVHLVAAPGGPFSVRWVNVTDATGRFQFESLYATDYRLVVPSVALAADVGSFAITPGEDHDLGNIRGSIRPVFRVAGHARIAVGSVPHVTAYLDVADDAFMTPLSLQSTALDKDGTFVFSDVPEGRYRIRVDTAPARLGDLPPYEVRWGLTAVDVDRDLTDVTVEIHTGAEVRGEIAYEGSRRPGPTADVLLLLAREDGRQPGSRLSTNTGVFVTRGLTPDRYSIRASGIPAGLQVKRITADGRDVTDSPIELGRVVVNRLVVTLTDESAEIRGRVLREDGQEDGTATVLLFPVDEALWSSPRRTSGTRVTQRGSYSQVSLPPGDYFAVATTIGPPLAGNGHDRHVLRRLVPLATRVRLDYGVVTTQDLRRQVLK
jgi:hypothetical protein